VGSGAAELVNCYLRSGGIGGYVPGGGAVKPGGGGGGGGGGAE